MTTLIRYPIPLPERAELEAAGKLAINHTVNQKQRDEAHIRVEEVTEAIRLRYGVKTHAKSNG